MPAPFLRWVAVRKQTDRPTEPASPQNPQPSQPTAQPESPLMRAATIEHEIQTLIEPLVADFGAEVFDVAWGGGRLKVAVDAPGGIDTATLSKVSRTISQELDLHDPISSRYTLEVSSPGLERRLRRPEHFAKSIGRSVTLKLRDGKTRLSGEIIEATEADVTLRMADDDSAEAEGSTTRTIGYDDIARAQTVFQWQGASA